MTNREEPVQTIDEARAALRELFGQDLIIESAGQDAWGIWLVELPEFAQAEILFHGGFTATAGNYQIDVEAP